MSNETLILKTAVATNSTVKLTDCPMSSGEILEMVCRLYANGLTSGNRCFKAIGNAVTYNTDAVTEGDIYCVSYRDGGFYVGLRTTEDYEPKEGDWWCISSNTQNQPYKPYPSTPIVLNNVCPNDTYVIVYDKASHIIFAGINTNVDSGYYIAIQAYVNGSYIACATSKTNATDLMWPVKSVTIGSKITFRTGKNVDNIQTDFGIDVLTAIGPTCFLMKTINSSDILSYQNTGKMGGIILGEEINVSYSSNHTSCSMTIDNAKDYAIFFFDVDNNLVNVEYETQNRHGAKGTIYNANASNIYNIYATQLFDKMYIYNKDFEAVYDDGVISREMTLNLTNDGIAYAYTIRAFKVLQNNMTNV